MTPDQFQYAVSKNQRYHNHAQKMYLRLNKFCSLITLGFTLGAVTTALKSAGDGWFIACSILAAVAGLIDVIWGFSDRAMQHSRLEMRYIDLESRLDEFINENGDNEETIKAFMKTALWVYNEIAKEEPPTDEALNSLCNNEMVIAWNDGSPDKISWYNRQRLKYLYGATLC